MSTVLPTDKMLVQRGTALHSAPSDLSTAQDADLLLINRAGVDYHCTFKDWKDSQSKPPAIAGVTLADSPEAGRFTSGSFASAVNMADEGLPASTKGIRAYVQGTLKSAARTSAITSFKQNTSGALFNPALMSPNITLSAGNATATQTTAGGIVKTTNSGTIGTAGVARWTFTILAFGPTYVGVGLASADALTSAGYLGDRNTFGAQVDAARVQFFVTDIADGPTYGSVATTVAIGSTIEFAVDLATKVITVSLNGAVIDTRNCTLPNGAFIYGAFGSNAAGGQASVQSTTYTITLADSVGLADFAAGDAITEVTAAGVAGDATGKVASVDAAAGTLTLSSSTGTWDVGSAVKGPLKTAMTSLQTDEIVGVSSVSSMRVLAFKTAKDLAAFAAHDAVRQDDGMASGTVYSIDTTALTMKVVANTGTWGPANTGRSVLGPGRPSTSVKLYCKLNAGLTVTDLQSADPGFTAVTGAGPYVVTFPATLPSGSAPDVDLPAGTTIATEVQAVNASGTVTKTSNTVTPV